MGNLSLLSRCEMFDNLQVLFWSIVYIIIIINSLKYREEHKPMMPYISGGANLAWELNALIRYHHFAHIIWSGLDIFIFIWNCRNLGTIRKRGFYTMYVFALFTLLYRTFGVSNGMLISVFAIDMIMAMEYVIRAKNITMHGKLWIAVFKLIGDLFAGLFYWNQSIFVKITCIIVTLLNIYYLAYCMEERSDPKTLRRR